MMFVPIASAVIVGVIMATASMAALTNPRAEPELDRRCSEEVESVDLARVDGMPCIVVQFIGDDALTVCLTPPQE